MRNGVDRNPGERQFVTDRMNVIGSRAAARGFSLFSLASVPLITGTSAT